LRLYRVNRSIRERAGLPEIPQPLPDPEEPARLEDQEDDDQDSEDGRFDLEITSDRVQWSGSRKKMAM